MKIRKTENHHMLLLPVLLILAAAFLATSLTGSFRSGNELTGHAVNAAVSGRCDWYDAYDGQTNSTQAVCPSGRSTVISGGCEIWDNQNGAISGSRMFSRANNGTVQQGWTCTANGQVQSIQASALCCRI